MTGADALRGAVARLVAGGIDAASTDARHLLAHAMGVAPDRLILRLQDPLDRDMVQALNAAVTARLARQPVAQITGTRLFWGRSFMVTPDVLDPRPETEMLVAAALEEAFASVLDLGTGSGAILLSVLADRPLASGLGVDLSDAALAVARANATALGVQDRARLEPSDWFSAVNGLFELIVSNPPYITQSEMAALSPEVRDWEPHLALTPGGDGLDAYRALAKGAMAHLKPGGRLMVEIGPSQASAVSALFSAAGFSTPVTRQDLDGRDRIVTTRRP